MKKRRVVITGAGLVTPLGLCLADTWSALCAGRSGVGEITRFDASGFKTRIAAEVKGFRPEAYLSRKEASRTHPFIAYAVAAARMALEDAGLVIDETNADRVGVLTGCGMGGLNLVEDTAMTLEGKGPSRVRPFFIPMMIGSMAPGMISIHFGARGPNSSVASACAAGTHAVGEAFRLIQGGYADHMITGGVESVISPSCIAGFNAMRALSTRNDDPAGACRPFDGDRDGFVVGEGSGILILESLDSALARGAKIYAEVAGFGMNADAWHITAPDPDGSGAARCMTLALDDAGLCPDVVDYINAHGTGTEMNDRVETSAIKTVFGEHSRKIAVSSTKSMTGHLLGGSGGIEAVFTALSIEKGVVPPTINLDRPDDACDLDYVPHLSRRRDVGVAVSNSFAFGGINASLVLSTSSSSLATGPDAPSSARM